MSLLESDPYSRTFLVLLNGEVDTVDNWRLCLVPVSLTESVEWSWPCSMLSSLLGGQS